MPLTSQPLIVKSGASQILLKEANWGFYSPGSIVSKRRRSPLQGLLLDGTIPFTALGACSCTQSAHPANQGGGHLHVPACWNSMACGASYVMDRKFRRHGRARPASACCGTTVRSPSAVLRVKKTERCKKIYASRTAVSDDVAVRIDPWWYENRGQGYDF